MSIQVNHGTATVVVQDSVEARGPAELLAAQSPYGGARARAQQERRRYSAADVHAAFLSVARAMGDDGTLLVDALEAVQP